jgi:hypothetical protein
LLIKTKLQEGEINLVKKIILLILATASVCFFSVSFTIEADANLISDNYIGADAHGRGDVIGDKDIFEIFEAEVYRSGNDLYVNIITNFAGHAGVFDCFTPDGNGIGYGDLFLSTSWDPYGTAPDYNDDDHSNGTLWTYGFSLDDRWDDNGGDGWLYSLNGDSNDANALLSEDFLDGGIFRNGQEAAVDTLSGNAAYTGLEGTWGVDGDENLVSFVIDITGTGLETSDQIAFHWGMTCMNDTIEGSAPVPEPTTMLLTGFGLLGMGIYYRARKSRKS